MFKAKIHEKPVKYTWFLCNKPALLIKIILNNFFYKVQYSNFFYFQKNIFSTNFIINIQFFQQKQHSCSFISMPYILCGEHLSTPTNIMHLR